MLDIRVINQKFNVNINLLNYYTVKAKVEIFMSKQRPRGICNIEKPTYPFHLDVLLNSQKGCRKIYEAFNCSNSQYENPTSKIIWTNAIHNEDLNLDINERWKQIYKVCFYSVLDNNIIWFQYRILNKILGTRDYLKKIRINTN